MRFEMWTEIKVKLYTYPSAIIKPNMSMTRPTLGGSAAVSRICAPSQGAMTDVGRDTRSLHTSRAL